MKTKIIFTTFFILFIFAFNIKNQAQEVLVSSANGEDTYIITNTIKKVNNSITEVWLKIKLSGENTQYYRNKYIEFHNRSALDYSRYSYMNVKRRYDCINNKVAVLQNHTFTEDDKLIENEEVDPSHWFSIVPNTLSEKIFNYICK